MASTIQSIVEAGTKVWLDSVDPDEVRKNRPRGISGATSNPIIVGDLIRSGRFDKDLAKRINEGKSDAEIAWLMTDQLVHAAQEAFFDVWEQTRGDDGYVSFELDPLLDAADSKFSHADRVQRYVDEARRWSQGDDNRMIKVPATAAGLDALEDIAAAGIPLNVTLVFTQRQYEAARDAIWRGAQRLDSLDRFKSVYSIFISRVDVYAEKKLDRLSKDARRVLGLVNAKRMWRLNETFWSEHATPLKQEIIFASTGAKLDWQEPDYYVQALVGSGIQTTPPSTLDALEQSSKRYEASIERLPPRPLLEEIDREVDMAALEDALMTEGLAKFAEPFEALLAAIGEKRQKLAA